MRFLALALTLWSADTHAQEVPTRCEDLPRFVNTRADVASALNDCINGVFPGSTVELPPGDYWVGSPVEVYLPVVLRTAGTTDAQPACEAEGAPPCARLRALPTMNAADLGFFRMWADGAVVDHLVIDGNKRERRHTEAGEACRAGNNSGGMNVRMDCGSCRLSGSTIRDALCGTGLLVTVGVTPDGKVIARNRVVGNGTHAETRMWADGVTVHATHRGLYLQDNLIRDNSDVDLIVASCEGCRIEDNRITHLASWAQRSFAAFMLHSWAGPARYPGTVIARNTIDCGPRRACLFGMQLGSRPWSTGSPVHVGGEVNDNVVRNARVGIDVSAMRGLTLAGNRVTKSGGEKNLRRCGPRTFPAFNVSPDSRVRIRGGTHPNGRGVSSYPWKSCLPI